MATYTTCKNCLGVNVDVHEVASVDVETRSASRVVDTDHGSVDWIEYECQGCGNSSRSVSGSAFGGDVPAGFESLDAQEIHTRRERVETLTGETPWE